jgi:hypothetical protein
LPLKEIDKMKILVALSVALLAACTSSPSKWEPDGAMGAFNWDKGQCMAQAKLNPTTGNAYADADSQDDFFRACMHRMGWRERQ